MERRLLCRKDIFGDVISFYFKTRTPNGIEIAEPLTMRELSTEQSFVEPMPTFSLLPQEAQVLMDSLWDAGLRPTEGSGSAGAMAATQRHLEDMRTLVFKPENRND